MKRDEFLQACKKDYQKRLNLDYDAESNECFGKAFDQLQKKGLAKDLDSEFVPVLTDTYIAGIHEQQNFSVKN